MYLESEAGSGAINGLAAAKSGRMKATIFRASGEYIFKPGRSTTGFQFTECVVELSRADR